MLDIGLEGEQEGVLINTFGSLGLQIEAGVTKYQPPNRIKQIYARETVLGSFDASLGRLTAGRP